MSRPHDTTLSDYFTCILPSSVLQEPKESGIKLRTKSKVHVSICTSLRAAVISSLDETLDFPLETVFTCRFVRLKEDDKEEKEVGDEQGVAEE
eukprot:g56629.t1